MQRYSKRGQGLSMNLVVVAVIAVLVLVVIAIIFTGGVGNVAQRIQTFFTLGTSAQSEAFVIEQCKIACDQAEISGSPERSAYCQTKFSFDRDHNGIVEDNDESELLDEKGITCDKLNGELRLGCSVSCP